MTKMELISIGRESILLILTKEKQRYPQILIYLFPLLSQSLHNPLADQIVTRYKRTVGIAPNKTPAFFMAT